MDDQEVDAGGGALKAMAFARNLFRDKDVR
jgi:hypothetical protein